LTQARYKTLTIVTGIFLAQAAWAEEGLPLFSLSGFGTLGAVYHDRKGVEFRRNISEPNGAKNGELSFAQDSMLGVQATARPGSQFEATLQLVSRHNIGVDYTPQVAWAYAKFKPVEEISLRAGRLGIELYLQGDSAEIGYANLPIRQPDFFYPRTLDGMDADHTSLLGGGSLRLKGMAGTLIGKLISNGPTYDPRGSKFWGVLAEYTRHGWTGRISGGHYSFHNEIQEPQYTSLKNALSWSPNGAEILASLSLKDRPITYFSAAVAYDSGPLQGNVNFRRLASPKWATLHTIFAQLGYRQGDFTPYVSYALQYADRSLIPAGSPSAELNQEMAVAQSTLKANQSDIGLGLRYDFSHTAALKFQVDQIRYKDSQNIIDPALKFDNVANRSNRTLLLLSAALEFVF
jgi:hypothetical protein